MIKKILHIGKIDADKLTEYMFDKVNQLMIIVETEEDLIKTKAESLRFPIPTLVYNNIDGPNIDVTQYDCLSINSQSDLVIKVLNKYKFKKVFCLVTNEKVDKILLENYKKQKNFYESENGDI